MRTVRKKKEKKDVKFTFSNNVLGELEISIFSPQKDQFDMCVAYENKHPSITEEVFELHKKLNLKRKKI